MRFWFTFFCLLVAGAAEANCDEEVSPSEFARQVSLGDAAFSEMDADAFRQALFWIDDALPCLSDGLSTGQITSLHRLQALDAFSDQDPALTTLFMRSVLANAPNYELPDLIAPDGHPLRLHFRVAQGLPAASSVPISAPRRGWILVDGQGVNAVPPDRPFVFQVFDENGHAEDTVMVMPGGDIPRYPGAGRGVRRFSLPLMVASGVAALGSGALYLASSQAEASFWDPTTPDADLEALMAQANGLSWASLIVGTASVGTGVAAVVRGSF